MKAELYTNCSLVRIPIKAGVSEYAFPQNVEWANERVDKMVIVAPQIVCLDPVDGVTPVMDASTIGDMFVRLYDAQNHEVMYDASYEQVLHRNNHPLNVNAQLNLSLCRVHFTQAPVQDYTLLIYVYYGTRTEEYFDLPKRSITTEFELAANEQLSLQQIINTYVHALPNTIKGIICWNAETDPAWLTLRDYKLTYQMVNVHSELCRSDMNAGTNQAADCQAALFLLNDLDIDFDYSHIREAAGQTSKQKITFLY